MQLGLGSSLSKNALANADGLSLSLNFAATKSLSALTGPTPTFSRALNTGTYFGSDGLLKTALADEPRFDHDPIGRTNLLLNSNTPANWGNNNGQPIADSNILDPFGSLVPSWRLAHSVSPSASFGLVSVTQQTGTHTFSVCLKRVNKDFIRIQFIREIAVSFQNVWFNLATGSVGTVGAAGTGLTAVSQSITSLGDGWYRCSVTCSVTIAPTTLGAAIISAAGDNDTVRGSDMIYGFAAAQLETASAPTAFITTTNESITVRDCKGLLIEESSTNLLRYSEDYTNSVWTKFQSSVTTSPAVSPAGGSCNRITMGAGTSTFPLYGTGFATVASRVVTLSAYVRYVNAQWIWIRGNDGGATTTIWASFDLQNKVIGGKLSGVTSHNITNVGNGWCRIEMTYTEVSTNSGVDMTFRVGNASTPTNSATTQLGTEQFDLWGAQLEAKAFSTSYIPTTTGTASRSADLCSITGSAFTSFYNQTEGTILSSSSMPSIPSTVSLAYAFDDNSDNERHNFRHNTTFQVTQVGGVNQAQFIGTAPTAGSVTKFAVAYKVTDYAATKNGTLLTSSSGSFASVPATTQVYIGSKRGASDFLNGHIQYIKAFKKRLPNAKLQSLTT